MKLPKLPLAVNTLGRVSEQLYQKAPKPTKTLLETQIYQHLYSFLRNQIAAIFIMIKKAKRTIIAALVL